MPTVKYLWDMDMYLADLDGGGTITTIYTAEPEQFGRLVSVRTDGATSYCHFDSVGSTRQLTVPSGVVSDTWLYDAWGSAFIRTGTTSLALTWAGEQGYYIDKEIGLIYVRERTYRAASGNWTSADPLLHLTSATVAWYKYADNCPILLRDPSGLLCIVDPPKECGDDDWKTIIVDARFWKSSDWNTDGENFDMGKRFSGDVSTANDIWKQCCIKIKAGSTDSPKPAPTPKDDSRVANTVEGWKAEGSLLLDKNYNVRSKEGEIHVTAHYIYKYVNRKTGDVDGFLQGLTPTVKSSRKVSSLLSVKNGASKQTFAHELGHSLSLSHDGTIKGDLMFPTDEGKKISREQCQSAREAIENGVVYIPDSLESIGNPK